MLLLLLPLGGRCRPCNVCQAQSHPLLERDTSSAMTCHAAGVTNVGISTPGGVSRTRLCAAGAMNPAGLMTQDACRAASSLHRRGMRETSIQSVTSRLGCHSKDRGRRCRLGTLLESPYGPPSAGQTLTQSPRGAEDNTPGGTLTVSPTASSTDPSRGVIHTNAVWAFQTRVCVAYKCRPQPRHSPPKAAPELLRSPCLSTWAAPPCEMHCGGGGGTQPMAIGLESTDSLVPAFSG